MILTILRLNQDDKVLPTETFFIHEPFESVVEFFEQGSLNSVVNEVEGYANITYEIRDEKGLWVNRKVRVERMLA